MPDFEPPGSEDAVDEGPRQGYHGNPSSELTDILRCEFDDMTGPPSMTERDIATARGGCRTVHNAAVFRHLQAIDEWVANVQESCWAP